jgi:tripartite-type tricarboxylate transporter receptor subunit TctC
VMAHIRAGTITPLAVASRQRLAVLPEVPTSVEAGLPDWQMSSWFGLMAPAGTPADIIDRLRSETARALAQASVQRMMADSGMQGVGNTPDAFARFIRDERKKWGEVIRAANIEAN